MLKTSRKSNKKLVTVIKNEHTRAEMRQLDDEWASQTGPYLTIEQVLDNQANKEQSKS